MKFIITVKEVTTAKEKDLKKPLKKKNDKKLSKIMASAIDKSNVETSVVDESLVVTIIDDIELAKKLFVFYRSFDALIVEVEATD